MEHWSADRRTTAMKTAELLIPEICREALRRFWDDQTDVAETSEGVAGVSALERQLDELVPAL
jgi:hypothetical protein